MDAAAPPAGNGAPPLPAARPFPVIDRGRSFREVENNKVEVYDLDFAAYCLMRGLPLAEALKDGREFRFAFLDSNRQVTALAIDYTNSESAKYADVIRRLKKVTMSSNAPGWRNGSR